MTDDRVPVTQLRWSSPPVILAITITIGFFAALFTMLLVTETNADIMVGALIAAVSSVIGYFFGSSSQSAGKDAAINDLTKTAAAVATTAQASQVAADAAANTPTVPTRADNVEITADQATVITKDHP